MNKPLIRSKYDAIVDADALQAHAPANPDDIQLHALAKADGPAKSEPQLFQAATAADQEPRGDFDLRSLLRALLVRRQTIINTVIVIMTVTSLIVLPMPSVYRATAFVMVGNESKVLNGAAAPSEVSTDAASVQNQVQILKSSAIASNVIAKLNLTRDPELKGFALTTFGYFDWVPEEWRVDASPGQGEGKQTIALIVDPSILREFIGRLTVGTQGRSSVLRVSFDSHDAEKAAKIANAVANQYIVDQVTTKFDAAKRVSSALSERLEQLAQEVRAAESEVARYKVENGLTDANDGVTPAGQQFRDINAQVVLARSNLAEQEAKYRQVSSLYRGGQSVETIASVVNSPLIWTLRGQQAELIRREGELSTKYGENHPQMIALKEENAKLEANIQGEVKRIIQSLANEVSVARARLDSLQTSLQHIKESVDTQSHASIKLHQLQRDAESTRAAYQMLLARFKEIGNNAVIPTPDARVIAAATVPLGASFPDKPMMLGVMLLVSAALGVALALTLERLNNTYRTGAEIEHQLQVTNLTVVPRVPWTKRLTERVVNEPLSSFTESIRSLHASIQLSNDTGQRARVVLCTSALPHEGSTSIAVSLARLAAKGGSRVILIDCDMRHPEVVSALSARTPDLGLVEYLSGACDLASVVARDDLSALDYIAVSSSPSDSSGLISSQAMSNLMATLRDRYELIILDAGPVIPNSDSRLLARLADKVIYVVRWNYTPREAVVRGLKMLRDSSAVLLGAVLNQADLRLHAIYGYGTNFGYGKQYGNYPTN